jgi:hypothetical protein
MTEFIKEQNSFEEVKEGTATAQLKKHTIEVHGKPIVESASGDVVSVQDCLRAGEKAGYKNIAVYDLKEYLESNGNCRRLNQGDFPYNGSVMVTDVNVAG